MAVRYFEKLAKIETKRPASGLASEFSATKFPSLQAPV
jgi:hypothetical protein